MFGWHHWLDGRESEWTLGVGDGEGGLACCDSWSCKESDTTEQLNWTEVGHSFSSKEQASFNFMAAVTICNDLGPPRIVSHCFYCFPIYFHEVMGEDPMILVSWMLSIKPTFSLSSFTFIKRLFTSLLSAIRVVSSVYLRLLIFLLAILIPAYVSSSPAFCMMYSAYK